MNRENFYISSVIFDKNEDNNLKLINIRGKTKEYYFTCVIVPVPEDFIKDRNNEINESTIIVPIYLNDTLQYFLIDLKFVKNQKKLIDIHSYINFENLIYKKIKLTDKHFKYNKYNIPVVVWTVLTGMITAHI